MIRLQVNDLMVFKYLFEEKYIHRDLIKKYLFAGYNKSYFRQRISQLKKEGFVYSKPDPFSGEGREVIFPTEKALFFYDVKFKDFKKRLSQRGNSKLALFEPREYKIYDELNINELVHKNYITESRFIMENLGVDEWKNELFFYNKYKKNPDAIFKISKYTYALEFEYTFKNKRRYNGIIQRYERIKKIDFDYIIYLTSEDFVYNRLKNIFNVRKVPQIHNEWYKRYYLLKFEDLSKGVFTLNNFATGDILEYTSRLKKYVHNKRGRGIID